MEESTNYLNEHNTTGITLVFDVNNNINNVNRILFNCTSTQGASAAPGVAVRNGVVYVVTMLLCGFPDWYYDSRSESFRKNFPNNCRVEQGADMTAIEFKAKTDNEKLWEEMRL
ncbi:hypothetical protein DPMN_145981 [Dreissena polymorpha]|uniref:Uncharacterized protein n=1 Tax=Dreissena polymorpha TaxID=45954 RepID=A0A9D4J1K3_DREPO|nr:hypothetical protein DPMN_145960 [Dreissena polymorpha]KAH3792484.1 hypothetical protein DPMN_145981 [Dreissena polymorpha]